LINISSLLLAILLVGFTPVSAGQVYQVSNHFAELQATRADPAEFIDSFNDGPHVLWQTDSSVIVFYLCNGDVVNKTVSGVDTLRFYGFCEDSEIEYIIPVRAPDAEPHIISQASRILALSDIHGEYELLVEILRESGVIDDNCHWKWMDGHLVIAGDVFDRGDKVNECLWLIRQLESEAERNGGGVHYILGNHELMVLRGDNRYVNQRYLDGIAKKTKIKYEDLYGPDMELGRWLRSKNTVIKINDILFVHAGISPFLVNRGFSLAYINETVRKSIDLRSSRLAFNDVARFLFGNKGPFWYRGYHYEKEDSYPMVSHSEIDSILDYYKATAIVVGHSEVEQVSGLYGNRIMAIDVPAEELNTLQGLLWEQGRFYRIIGKNDFQLIE